MMRGWRQKEKSETRTLWFAVDRENFEPFKISVQTSADIDDLKHDVIAKCNAGVSVVDLELWKASILPHLKFERWKLHRF
jgi:hypothetical protein